MERSRMPLDWLATSPTRLLAKINGLNKYFSRSRKVGRPSAHLPSENLYTRGVEASTLTGTTELSRSKAQCPSGTAVRDGRDSTDWMNDQRCSIEGKDGDAIRPANSDTRGEVDSVSTPTDAFLSNSCGIVADVAQKITDEETVALPAISVIGSECASVNEKCTEFEDDWIIIDKGQVLESYERSDRSKIDCCSYEAAELEQQPVRSVTWPRRIIGEASVMQSLETNIEQSPILFSLENKQYIGAPACARLEMPKGTPSCAITVIPAPDTGLWSLAEFKTILAQQADDDVAHPTFLDFVLFCRAPNGSGDLEPALKRYLHACGIQHRIRAPQMFTHSSKTTSIPRLSLGPYLWRRGELHQICLLHDDTASAMIQPLLPQTSATSSFQPLRVLGTGLGTIGVAVPTRQRLPNSSHQHSAIFGKRIIVKDIFDMRGLKISACNKAYYSMQPTATTTAALIAKLVERGAHILGTSKLSSMISREEPGVSLDFQVPYNPRGDGYQSPAGNSSGCGAAIASYEWLDYAIGSDSTGSGRRPAFVNGCFALRLSSKRRYLEGMMPCFPIFDAPSLFSRSIVGMSSFVREWCDLSRGLPMNVLPLPRFTLLQGYPTDPPEQVDQVDLILNDMCGMYNVQAQFITLRSIWNHSPPPDAENQCIEDYLKDFAKITFFYDFHHSASKFREEHRQVVCTREHDCREEICYPLDNEVTRFRWNQASTYTKTMREEAGRRLEVYKKWLEEVLFGNAGFPVVAVPIASAKVNARDEHPRGDAWDPLLLAPTLGAPEVTIPIGEVRLASTITRAVEHFPIAISLLGRPGEDVNLLNFAEHILRSTNRPLEVRVGKRTFRER